MDTYLVEYLKSGKAWVLVGSGPSNAIGYPSWGQLAQIAQRLATQANGTPIKDLDRAVKRGDYPHAFDLALGFVSPEALLVELKAAMKATAIGEIYDLIAQWPVPVYLTTNYDDEIQVALAKNGDAYLPLSNSEDHLAQLVPGAHNLIVKLHGDLRSLTGLVLTSSQYKEITSGAYWQFWRTKMTSIFQMNPIVVVGHSLSDANFQHVLAAAKQGAGVVQPICWIAPDATTAQVREYLEKYRIRVIPYDNSDGKHANLLRLLRNVSNFVPPRESISIQEDIARVLESPLGNNAAAPGFFVFNKLAVRPDYEEKRVEIILASMQSALAELAKLGKFSLEKAFELSGWPLTHPISVDFRKQVEEKLVEEKILISDGKLFKVASDAEATASESKKRFELLREQFKASLILKLKRGFTVLKPDQVDMLARDIEASLTGYFRDGGLSLATTLFSTLDDRNRTLVPSSIIEFINKASARYDSLLMRQAFSDTSVYVFVQSGNIEREYLGRISQGFFAYHSLGVFGDVALERLREAKETVWLIDSNALIPALALASPTNAVFADCFARMTAAGIRLFTTEALFSEVYEHFRFADRTVRDYGPASSAVMSATIGDTPYRRGNEFLQGFLRWQAAGNAHDWGNYLFEAFGSRDPSERQVGETLTSLGVEIVDFEVWPGYEIKDCGVADTYLERIAHLHENRNAAKDLAENKPVPQVSLGSDSYRKAAPEAEAFLIVKNEREGKYSILKDPPTTCPAWFISNTAVLNIVDGRRNQITWQPEAFLRFASTLPCEPDDASSERAFQTVLWNCAESGLVLIDEKIFSSAIGGSIDQMKLNLLEQRELYAETIESKYGESPEAILARIRPSRIPMVAMQLNTEMMQVLDSRREHAEESARTATRRAQTAEKELEQLEKFKLLMETKKAKSKRNIRKKQAQKKKK